MGHTHSFLHYVSTLRHRRHDRISWEKLLPRFRKTQYLDALGAQAVPNVPEMASLSSRRITPSSHRSHVDAHNDDYQADEPKLVHFTLLSFLRLVLLLFLSLLSLLGFLNSLRRRSRRGLRWRFHL